MCACPITTSPLLPIRDKTKESVFFSRPTAKGKPTHTDTHTHTNSFRLGNGAHSVCFHLCWLAFFVSQSQRGVVERVIAVACKRVVAAEGRCRPTGTADRDKLCENEPLVRRRNRPTNKTTQRQRRRQQQKKNTKKKQRRRRRRTENSDAHPLNAPFQSPIRLDKLKTAGSKQRS